MANPVERLLCTVFKSEPRCNKVAKAAAAGASKTEGPKVKAAVEAPRTLKPIKAAGSRGLGALPLVGIAPGQTDRLNAAGAALASKQQREEAPNLSAGLWAQPCAGRPYQTSAWFDASDSLSRQELWAWEARRAVDGHLPLLVALGGSFLMLWYLRGLPSL